MPCRLGCAVPGVGDVGRRDLLEHRADVGRRRRACRASSRWQTRSSTARRISAVAAVASVALVMAPPTTTMPAPAATAAAAVSELMPPAALTGIDDGLGDGAQRVERRLAAHLLVDRGVDADVVGARLLGLRAPGRPGRRPRSCRRSACSRSCGPPRRTPGSSSRMATPSTPTRPAPALAAYSTSMRPASMVFMSATIGRSGKLGLELAHGLQALGLDQRRAGLDPVDAAGHRLAARPRWRAADRRSRGRSGRRRAVRRARRRPTARSYAHHLDDELTLAGPGVEVAEDDVLVTCPA